jgi:hypothetical protein
MGKSIRNRPFGQAFTPFDPQIGQYGRLGPADIKVFIVAASYHDHIVTECGKEVAKPYHLRRSPFDYDRLVIFDGDEDWTGIFDETHKYEYDDDLIGRRKLIYVDENGDEQDNYVYQMISPAYSVGEVIIARKSKTGIVDYNATDNKKARVLTYVDLNLAGREWKGITASLTAGIITEIHYDYLTISYEIDGQDEAESILVAKPHMLRKSPFDGQTVNDVTYTYSEDDENERIATEDSVDTTEYLRPAYYVGEEITFARIEENITIADDGDEEIEVRYVDANLAGRAWSSDIGLPKIYEAVSDASGGTITAKRIDSDGNLVGDTETFAILPE